MNDDHATRRLAQDERRRDERRTATDEATIRLGDETMTGRVENLSDGGLFVVLDAPLSVEVELGAVRGVPPQRAILVRSQALPGGKSGWGLQFDRDHRDEQDA